MCFVLNMASGAWWVRCPSRPHDDAYWLFVKTFSKHGWKRMRDLVWPVSYRYL